MTKFKKHDDSDVRWLYSEYKKLRKESKSIMQKDRKLEKENKRLKDTVRYLRLDIKELVVQLKELKEMVFKKVSKKKWLPWQKDDEDEDDKDKKPKKPGAKKGHKGKTRKKPERVDVHQDVMLKECPECHGKDLSLCQRHEDHYQEDIIIPAKTEITRFRHHYYYCKGCGKTVHGTGIGELPGSYIGPRAKALAAYLRYHMSVPYRKVQTFLEKVFNMEVEMGSCVGFDKQIRSRGEPLYETLLKKIKDSPWMNADETGWKGKWLWCMGNMESVVYVIRPGRGQKDLKAILGNKYGGVLISDLLGAYNDIKCRKQRCLVHLLRLIKKWLVYFDYDKRTVKYLLNLKKVVQEIITLSNSMAGKMPKDFIERKADIVGRLKRLLSKEQRLKKAENFRKRTLERVEEFITCLDYAEVCAHNNLAERNLRPNVIMRKVTHGNRSEEGIKNHEILMSLLQTAKLKEHNPFEYLHTLLTNPIMAQEAIS